MIRTTICICLMILTASICLVMFSVALAIDRIPEIAAKEAAETREMLRGEITETRGSVVAELATTAKMLDRQATATRRETLAEVRALRTDAVQRIDGALAVVDDRTKGWNRVAPAMESLLERYEAVPDQLATSLAPYTNCEVNSLCWQGLVTDNLFAARVTSRAIGTSVPSAMKSIERASVSAADASLATAGVARNLEKATKPLPWWVRFVPIAGSASQVAVPFVLGNLK